MANQMETGPDVKSSAAADHNEGQTMKIGILGTGNIGKGIAPGGAARRTAPSPSGSHTRSSSNKTAA